jgi:hypothetical protein
MTETSIRTCEWSHMKSSLTSVHTHWVSIIKRISAISFDFSCDQEIPRLLQNLNVYYRAHNNPLLNPLVC